MKFVLVNHRAPLDRATCTECAQSLGTGYLREVSTQRSYCDYDCYHRHQARSLFMPWLKSARADSRIASPHASPFELMASFAAASCWYSISLTKAALRVAELLATELTDLDRRRT
jgi:hypothetical protein